VSYELAADLTAFVHFGFIAFVMFGTLLGCRSPWWRIVHIVAMAYAVLAEVFYWYCPLTYLEQYLRSRTGQSSYAEPFIAHYLNAIIYIDVPQWSLILAASVVLGVNTAIYIRFPAPSSRKPSTLRGR
jgi:uncharacterized protein DUF2784